MYFSTMVAVGNYLQKNDYFASTGDLGRSAIDLPQPYNVTSPSCGKHRRRDQR
jgi:hypothetical protein